MFNRIIRIAAALTGCILLMTGCIWKGSLDPDGEAIRFSAGSLLLRDDAPTKGTTEDFITNEEKFVVFGEKVSSANVHTEVFNGVNVTHDYISEGNTVTKNKWHYDNPKSWDWSTADHYDFVAIYPAEKGSIKEQVVAGSNLSVITAYNCQSDEYDLLATAYRRWGRDSNPSSEVHLAFTHMGSAVGITVHNISQNKRIAVSSLHFKNLVCTANARATLDNYGDQVLSWVNSVRSTSDVREQMVANPSFFAPEGQYTGEYQIMIPQDLSIPGSEQPTLVLKYIPQTGSEETPIINNEITKEIPLGTIEREDGTPISRWELGAKYNYHIYIRLDGGLRVTVTPPPGGEPVQAETPGILI